MHPLDRRAEDLENMVQDILNQFQMVHAAIANGPHIELNNQELRLVEFLGDSGLQMMRALAEHLAVAVNSVTAIVDNLERKGLVARQRSEEDRRVIRVELTESGRVMYQAARRAKLQLFRSMLEALTEDEQEILLVLIRKISRAGRSQIQSMVSVAP